MLFGVLFIASRLNGLIVANKCFETISETILTETEANYLNWNFDWIWASSMGEEESCAIDIRIWEFWSESELTQTTLEKEKLLSTWYEEKTPKGQI